MKPHKWEPVKSSRGTWGYHVYKCAACGADTHIGLDIDYEAKVCKGKPKSKRPTARDGAE
jgi:DNA-directed RNA polymerase subunit RPC12/RpoP